MDIAIRDLGYFLAVAEQGNVALAARLCNVTQPAISKSIRRLEETLAMQLFHRSRQGMALTASGEMFHRHALRIRREHDETMQHAEDLRVGSAGLLRLGATRPAYDAVVVPALAAVFRDRPKMRVCLELGAADTLLEMLVRGELDMVCGPVKSRIHRDLEFQAFSTDELVVIAASDHPAFLLDAPGLPDLLAWRWVLPKKTAGALQWFNDRFHRAGLMPPEAALEVDYVGVSTLSLIASTSLLLFTPVGTPLSELSSGVRRLHVPELHTQRRLYIAMRRDSYRSAVMNHIARLLSGQAQGMDA